MEFPDFNPNLTENQHDHDGQASTVDLPGKSVGTFCRLVYLSHLGFECDG
jgi:hypothetical protein